MSSPCQLITIESSNFLDHHNGNVTDGSFATAPCAPSEVINNRISTSQPFQLLSPIDKTSSRTEFVTALARKLTAETRIGISFQNLRDGSLIISDIKADGLFANCQLSPGDVVESLNDISCFGDGYKAAILNVRQTTGPVTIRTHNQSGTKGMVTTTIVKPWSSALSLGLGFENNIEGMLCAGLTASSSSSSSMFQFGVSIDSINGITCRNVSADCAMAMIENVDDLVTIVSTRLVSSSLLIPAARATQSRKQSASSVAAARARPEFINAVAWKPTLETRLGIHFQSLSNGSLVVAQIDTNGLFSQSALCPGDRVISINSIPCSGEGYREAIRLVRYVTGPVMIRARNVLGIPGKAMVTIKNPSSTGGLPVSLRSIDETGLFIGSCNVLPPGNRILTVNGSDCTRMRSNSAIEKLIQSVHGMVTIISSNN